MCAWLVPIPITKREFIRWFYRFEPGPGDTTAAELGYHVLRPVPVFLHLSLRLLGVRDLRADLHQNMATSLQKLARIAERQAQVASSGDPAR